MSRSFRVVVKNFQGHVRENFNFPTFPNGDQELFYKSHNLAINVTAAQIRPPEIDSNVVGDTPSRNYIYFLGDAVVWVTNIAPHFSDHFRGEVSGVEFVLHSSFDGRIDVAYTVTVEDKHVENINSL
jgi:hypothetical protein